MTGQFTDAQLAAAVARAVAAEAERDDLRKRLQSCAESVCAEERKTVAAEARIAAALALHAPDERNGVTTCSTCEAVDWPCPTAAALVEPVGPKEDA